MMGMSSSVVSDIWGDLASAQPYLYRSPQWQRQQAAAAAAAAVAGTGVDASSGDLPPLALGPAFAHASAGSAAAGGSTPGTHAPVPHAPPAGGRTPG